MLIAACCTALLLSATGVGAASAVTTEPTGIGQATGDLYLGRGAGRGTVTHPPSPIRSAIFELTFTLLPPGPPVHPPSPIRLGAHIVFEENGRLSGLEVRLGQAPIGSVD